MAFAKYEWKWKRIETQRVGHDAQLFKGLLLAKPLNSQVQDVQGPNGQRTPESRKFLKRQIMMMVKVELEFSL